MDHKEFSSRGGKTVTPKKREALLKNAAKARAALAKKRREGRK